MTEDCSIMLKKNFAKATYYLNRVQNIVKGILIYALMVFMIGIHIRLETNLFNWVFFSLNMINLALIIRGTNTIKEIKQSLKVINMLKVYSLAVLILDILFIGVIGELPKPDQP